MKTYRFRFWDKTSNKMMNVYDSITFYKGGYWELNYFFTYKNPANNTVVLMQSTGFFDKNKKEIFESDIVTYNLNDETITGIVVFTETCITIDPTPEGVFAWEDLEVIGNIYENKNEKRRIK